MNGGYLVLGLASTRSEPHYEITGIENSDRYQCELTSLCRQSFNITIRPSFEVVRSDSKTLLVVYIAEAEPHAKPVYLRKRGVEQGTFRRIGPTDQICTKEDIDLLYRYRSRIKYEDSIREDASFEDFDFSVIELYRQRRRAIHSRASELALSNNALMKSLALYIEKQGKWFPTVAGLLLFGTSNSLRRLFPMSSRIDYIMISGREWVPDPENRYHSIEIREALITAIPRLQEHILSDLPQAFALDEKKLFRLDKPAIPRDVIREGVANALIHRDYTSDQPVQVRRYSNRIEFENAGYSLKDEELLGLPGSIPRNSKIATILHEINLAETKGTGIQTMRDGMRESNLTLPLIETSRGHNRFVLTLLTHHLFDQQDILWLKRFKQHNLNDSQALAMIVLREMGAITNSDYRMINSVDTLIASAHLRGLRDYGLIVQKGGGSKTYYVPSDDFFSSEHERAVSDTGENTPAISENTPAISQDALDVRESLYLRLPESIAPKLRDLGKRSSPTEIRALVKMICAHDHFSPEEIGILLRRSPAHLRRLYLSPMVEEGELEYLYPENPKHRRQAYKMPNVSAP